MSTTLLKCANTEYYLIWKDIYYVIKKCLMKWDK